MMHPCTGKQAHHGFMVGFAMPVGVGWRGELPVAARSPSVGAAAPAGESGGRLQPSENLSWGSRGKPLARSALGRAEGAVKSGGNNRLRVLPDLVTDTNEMSLTYCTRRGTISTMIISVSVYPPPAGGEGCEGSSAPPAGEDAAASRGSAPQGAGTAGSLAA